MAMFVSQKTKTKRERISKSGNSGTTKTGGRGPSSHPGHGQAQQVIPPVATEVMRPRKENK